jgi:hypothetical protein
MHDRPPLPRVRSPLTPRETELMRLLPLWPHEVADQSPSGRRRNLALLRRALRAERKRGLAGHWTYDLSRHAQLLALYRAECKNGRQTTAVSDAATAHRRTIFSEC